MTDAARPGLPPFLVGTSAHNPHVQNMVAALAGAGALERYVTGGVDVFHGVIGRSMRNAARLLPGLDRNLSRRRLDDVPPASIETHWGWEACRLIANRLGALRVEDACWEQGERALDRRCARLIAADRCGAYLGVEHGALASLDAARRAGKPGVLAFLSPHHRTRARWVDSEYDAMPGLRTTAGEALRRLAGRRDERRDREAALAAWIVSNSAFTTRSLIDAGIPDGKILTVPLGAPPAMPLSDLPPGPPATARFVYAGPVSVRKGAHYLLAAWRAVASQSAELHFYGAQLLPPDLVAEARRARGGDRLFLHGSVPASDLPAVYRSATALVLPTLCDGFAQVIGDALANGLPVITTANAGGADLVTHATSGFIVPAADADALATALGWCIDHPDVLHEMRRPALDSARRWSWTDYRRAFITALSTALLADRTTPADEAPAVRRHA